MNDENALYLTASLPVLPVAFARAFSAMFGMMIMPA